MLLSGIVSLLLATVSTTDTSQKRPHDAPILVVVQASADSLAAAMARFDAMSSIPRSVNVSELPATQWTRLFPADTPRARPRVVEVSDWYSRRLTIHRYLSYSVIPVFAVQYMAGRQLWDKGRNAPVWAKTTHRAGATALAGIFTVNTVTGVWNFWDSRSVPQGRALRTFHAITMLAADAGFTYAGAKLSQEAETSLEKRRQHRTLALSSMGLAIVSGVTMKLFNQ